MVTMKQIIGIDSSLTSTGIAVITQSLDGSCAAAVTTVTSRGKRGDTLVDRCHRLIEVRNEILYHAALAHLVVIEGASHGSRGGSALDRHGLRWAVVGNLIDVGVPVAVCAPATRARFATGAGTADKAAVSAAISRLWPQVELTNADTADALVLAHAGAVHLGWEVPTLQRHREVLGAIQWPAHLAHGREGDSDAA
jgi:Holliday junction resolvasome RuvABC endonuclease subunit